MIQPKIVCLCGSTRFKDEFFRVAYRETMLGHIVLTVHVFKHDLNGQPLDKDQNALDELHLHKIDMADEIIFLSIGGYIGDGGKREIAYAEAKGKSIRYLEEV